MTVPCNQQDKLDAIHTDIKLLNEKFEKFRLATSVDIAILKTKMVVYGAVAGVISSTAVTAIVNAISRH